MLECLFQFYQYFLSLPLIIYLFGFFETEAFESVVFILDSVGTWNPRSKLTYTQEKYQYKEKFNLFNFFKRLLKYM